MGEETDESDAKVMLHLCMSRYKHCQVCTPVLQRSALHDAAIVPRLLHEWPQRDDGPPVDGSEIPNNK